MIPMAETDAINAMIREAVRLVDETVPRTDARVAQGMTLLANTQATALAVQGAALHLREVSTVAVAALGAALGQILAGNDERGTAALAATKQALEDATEHLERVVALSQRVTDIPLPTPSEPGAPEP